ncbi:MAG: bifunctional response regulator/alkaline phosphatase family protein [Bacteroidales bacterium]|nr:bifunctional response regulator/alkaline phosphatase family protein [Bacteroidales bacterium]
MEKKTKILWVDDEIEFLRPYIIFLEKKGFSLSTATNGDDAISMVTESDFDLIFLDENMPGLSGLEVLSRVKSLKPFLPVVMITKSEEENIMDDAIGSKIADYLIKPVNPNQILLTIKKNIDTKRLVSEKTTSSYQSQFGKLSMSINSASSFKDWTDVYRSLVFWELELKASGDATMDEVLKHQKEEANREFSRFIQKNYKQWFDERVEERPLLSPSVFPRKVFPFLEKGHKVFFILIDNLRYDQWKILEKDILELCTLEEEEIYCGILPTATQYARNAMFAGLMPEEIFSIHPELWVFDEEEGGKNLMEKELFEKQLARTGLKSTFHYEKISNQRAGKKLVEMVSNLMNFDLNVIIYNFVDMLSHARTDTEMIRELADNEAAYRSLTLSWFRHSHLLDLFRILKGRDIQVILTTDHGSIKVENPVKVVGDKKTSSNLRYKLGRNLDYNPREVFEIRDPSAIHLPKPNISSSFIFAKGNDFLVYPNNYNHFVNYYRNTFQHGGVSMEEMMIPLVRLSF